MSEVITRGKAAKAASYKLVQATTEQKNEGLLLIAEQIVSDQAEIIAANKKDLRSGEENGLDKSVIDRIMLNEERIATMAHGIKLLVDLNDPIGEVLENSTLDNGLSVEKIRVPIGVIGMIYEARPNVTIDAATLSLKTSNAVILRGSSSAIHSNKALVQSIHRALEKSALPIDAVQLIEDTSRETAKELFQLNDYLDVLIPRGGKNLIDTVIRESTVPVIETGAGNCHAFIDESAQQEMAEQIVLNAKTQRPSVCNAIESILIHEKWFDQYGVSLLQKLQEANVQIIADKKVHEQFPATMLAEATDWATEYLELTVSVKLVSSCEEAIEHINKYGTHHSDTIITEDVQNKNLFLQTVDSAAVYHNASTRFTDGFEFGYGAEIGISTQKLHARGPMGLQALTSSKFVIEGSGQVRE
ncbi:glutamate-5-semialdehyde dehydrogenase [Pseudogracilibacillus sp. SE30717A]|uniref:glutamate-5-semialdehyde dehydrogenase n=1 Tax=Pseudogracilibacillus sp. SE30717A TaxID=3098293 RepID=UPI00300DE564